MAQGPRITDDVRRIIAEVWLEHQEWVAKEVMREVHSRLLKGNPNVKPNWPGLTAIQIELKKIRERYENRSPEEKEIDKPWTTYSLAEYPISPEALPSVLQISVRCRDRNRLFTIREAQWVGRFYAVIKDIENLITFSRIHAYDEIMSEITETGGRLSISVVEAIMSGIYGQPSKGAGGMDRMMLCIMLGEEITPEVIKKDWPFSDEEWKPIKEYLETGKPPEEAQNERTHNQEG